MTNDKNSKYDLEERIGLNVGIWKLDIY